MASIVNDTLNYEKYNAIDIANEAREKFPNNASINMLADYIIYQRKHCRSGGVSKRQKIFEQENMKKVLNYLIKLLTFIYKTIISR